MELSTTSALVSFYSNMEERVAGFYRELAESEKYVKGKKFFLAFSREILKDKKMVVRVYRESITDAFEACFSFTDLKADAYQIDNHFSEDSSLTDILHKAIELEGKSREFCLLASEKSNSLVAGIPQALKRVADKKADRMRILEELLE